MQAAGNGHLDTSRYLAQASAVFHVSHALHGWQSRTTPQEAQTEAQMIGTASAPYPLAQRARGVRRGSKRHVPAPLAQSAETLSSDTAKS